MEKQYKRPLNEFGKKVRIRLIELNKPQAWLIEEVQRRTGKYFDSSYFYKLSTGGARSKPMEQVILDILGLSGGKE